MKKTFFILNMLLGACILALTVRYDIEGGPLLKGVTASSFAVLGIVNLFYALLAKAANKRYPAWMAAGLVACMIGDIMLNIAFIAGVVFFAVGHILYCAALCCLRKPQKMDLIPIAVVFAAALVVLKRIPALTSGSAQMGWVCRGYALVISCMVGKAAANFFRQRSRVTALVLVGGILFFFSDLMLVLNCFGGAPQITNTLCTYTYFPAQCLLAHSVYHAVEQ